MSCVTSYTLYICIPSSAEQETEKVIDEFYRLGLNYSDRRKQVTPYLVGMRGTLYPNADKAEGMTYSLGIYEGPDCDELGRDLVLLSKKYPEIFIEGYYEDEYGYAGDFICQNGRFMGAERIEIYPKLTFDDFNSDEPTQEVVEIPAACTKFTVEQVLDGEPLEKAEYNNWEPVYEEYENEKPV